MITHTKYKFRWTHIAKYSEKTFVQTIVKKLNSFSKGRNINVKEKISSRATLIFEGNLYHVADETAQFHTLLMSYVLASIQVITEQHNEKVAKTFVKETFSEIGEFWVAISFKVGMFLSPNKFDFIIKNCGDGIKDYYGLGFDIEVNTDRKNYLLTRVTKCGFHEFFKNNGRPELTTLLCERDNIWSNLLKNNKYIDFDRPSTIASGNKTCDFIFNKKLT